MQNRYLQRSINSLKTAFNGGVRKLFNLSRDTSISGFLATINLPNFYAILRRSVYSLYGRMASSKNCILNRVFSSTLNMSPFIASVLSLFT